MINLDNFIWEQFPDRFKQEDTFKDGQDRGLLERYLSIFGIELQEEVIIKLEAFTDQLNPDTAEDKYVTEIAYSLGRPDDIFGDPLLYRTLLVNILGIYRVKGTLESYVKLFELYGFGVKIIEFFPPPNTYDMGSKYDRKGVDVLPYDRTQKNVGFVDYNIEYWNLPGQNRGPLTPQQAILLKGMIINTIQPIDTRIRTMTFIPN